MALIIEPRQYVADYGHAYLAEQVETAIQSNALPLGMSIDYALEVIAIANEGVRIKLNN
jgi:hypothetical protein